MGRGLGPPASRATQASPIGRPIASAAKTFRVHETLQQVNRMMIKFLPVGAQAPGDPSQQMTGQMRHLHPRHNEITSIVGDTVQMVSVTFLGRAYELIAQVQLPGSRTPSQTSQGPAPGPDQILKVLTDR